MILKGSQRGGAKDLALHLMKDENEHVELHELRGFASESLMGALNEVYAVSRGTRCRQFLYSLSLNPPQTERVSTAAFEAAIERAERKLGLSDQPRAIVFHEKEGRRHAHAVWSRIDTASMKAVHMSRDRTKLMAVSRELFLEHGWPMPDGLADGSKRDPRNFTLADLQQARRAGKDPRAVKAAFQDAWAISDSRAALINALEERGYLVARGDRRGYVAVDMHGEVYAIARQAGVKTKAVRERLGKADTLPSIEKVKDKIAGVMLAAVERAKDEVAETARERKAEFETRRGALVQRQRAERQSLRDKLEQRRAEENRMRQARFRKGLKGLWDFLRGEHGRIRRQNERDAEQSAKRDRAEKDQLIQRHLEQRRALDLFKLRLRREYIRERSFLESDSQTYKDMAMPKKRGGPEPE